MLQIWIKGLAERISTLILSAIYFHKEVSETKYGVAVTIVQSGYVELEADSEQEAIAKAAEAVSEDRVLYHETEVKECKIEAYF